jgi:hypothetical protein
MPSVEQEVKQQFARVFAARDAALFKAMAEFYIRRAAFLRKADIQIAAHLKLLARNCQKRLFIGIGSELLLKAIYLSKGFSINKIEDGQPATPRFPFTFQQVAGFAQVPDRTYMLNDLTDKLHIVLPGADMRSLMRGLKIAKVFRNKEGHVVLPTHTFDPSNYRDIEKAIIGLYSSAFQESLQLRFSVSPNEQPIWRLP